MGKRFHRREGHGMAFKHSSQTTRATHSGGQLWQMQVALDPCGTDKSQKTARTCLVNMLKATTACTQASRPPAAVQHGVGCSGRAHSTTSCLTASLPAVGSVAACPRRPPVHTLIQPSMAWLPTGSQHRQANCHTRGCNMTGPAVNPGTGPAVGAIGNNELSCKGDHSHPPHTTARQAQAACCVGVLVPIWQPPATGSSTVSCEPGDQGYTKMEEDTALTGQIDLPELLLPLMYEENI
ncbi:hypothetical protein DV515_00013436 [Chloebia gouldiae]|uniref:Uncharacterized protein n=1 Tax=Chloebia gouldiae TaxID=44316 RepID=A0A3L8S1D8_CHLGU|nr:hypothetical protein DV515_00013436 [Chloebia gouldiae]